MSDHIVPTGRAGAGIQPQVCCSLGICVSHCCGDKNQGDMGQNRNASSKFMQVVSVQQGRAELIFIFKYRTLGRERDYVLCLSFLFSNPSTTSSMEAFRTTPSPFTVQISGSLNESAFKNSDHCTPTQNCGESPAKGSTFLTSHMGNLISTYFGDPTASCCSNMWSVDQQPQSQLGA